MIPVGLLIFSSVKWGDKACGLRVFELLMFSGWGQCPSPSHSLFASSPQYVGSLDVPRPNSRVEIVAAMRRIRVSGPCV